VVEEEYNAKTRSFDKVIDHIGRAKRILISAHKNPDGDAVGCILAMSRILDTLKKQHTLFCPDGVPTKLAFMSHSDRVVRSVESTNFDLTLLFDTSARNLLPPGFPSDDQRGVLVVIDHHNQCDDMGDIIVRFPASAVGELLYEMAMYAGWPVDSLTAESLYTSIVSDTSSFKYESATAKCHRVAAELIQLGARPWRVAVHLFESVSIERQRLLATVLNTLEIGANGRYGQMLCTRQMLADAGATKNDLDGMINFARAIDGVELAALLREEANGDIKLSLRSKGSVDASHLAALFGGGGHKNAGGAYLGHTTITDAAKAVAEQALKILENNDASDVASPHYFLRLGRNQKKVSI
jgi:phosphoesterase RecJ-like protein